MTATTTVTGETVNLDGDFDELAADLTGTLIRFGDRDYDRTRTLWNATTARHPAAIAYGDRSAAHGGEGDARLRELKRRLDPGNVFRLHQDIPPGDD